ncbi:MAG: BCAM0308 family protein [Nitrospirota bacterium]
MTYSGSAAGPNTQRHDRFVKERRHDTYRSRGKPPEPTCCPDCGAVFQKGRWQWGEAPADAHLTVCPACQRTHDRMPAGVVTVAGEYFAAHREEILNLIHNVEDKEKTNHPLNRIMVLEERPEGVAISTTDTHLPRRLGEALLRAHGGELDLQYPEEEQLVRAAWSR